MIAYGTKVAALTRSTLASAMRGSSAWSAGRAPRGGASREAFSARSKAASRRAIDDRIAEVGDLLVHFNKAACTVLAELRKRGGGGGGVCGEHIVGGGVAIGEQVLEEVARWCRLLGGDFGASQALRGDAVRGGSHGWDLEDVREQAREPQGLGAEQGEEEEPQGLGADQGEEAEPTGLEEHHGREGAGPTLAAKAVATQQMTFPGSLWLR